MSDFLAELAKEASKTKTNVGSQPANNDYLSELAKQAQEQVRDKPDTNVAPKLGKGFVRGAMDVIDTGASAIGYLDQKIDEFLNTGGTERNKKFKER